MKAEVRQWEYNSLNKKGLTNVMQCSYLALLHEVKLWKLNTVEYG